MTAAPRYGEILTVRSVHTMNDERYFRFEEFRSFNIFSSGMHSPDEYQFHSQNFRPLSLAKAGLVDQVGLEPTKL